MTDQHRATPEQWANIERWGSAGPWDGSSCLLELRARIEALWEEMRERTDTLAAADGDTTSLIFKVTNRIEALEAAQLEQAESHRFCTDAIVGRVEALEATQHAHATLSHLSDAEREQVAQELAKPAAWRPLEVETAYGSGDAQRIAQELLKPRAMVVRGSFEHGGKQFSYEAEAMEAERPPHQDKLDRLIALDREDPTPDSTTPEPRPASAEAQPAGGLVERVAARIEFGIDANQDPEGIARAAIREVAAAARLRDQNGQSVAVMTWEMVAQWLEQEAGQ